MGADIFEGLIEGRIVHYVMPDGKHRPAIIVRVWDKAHTNGCVNLTVFTDWTNDSRGPDYVMDADCAAGKMWRTSVLFDGNTDPAPGTWHWIERA
ncbi:MAG: hypothetical protein WC837_04555 [Bellilinea sp.]